MSTLTGQFVSQSYGGLLHLSTNANIVGGTFTSIEDGGGNALGILVKTGGQVSGSGFTGSFNGTATSASFAITALSASFAISASFATTALSASFAISASRAQSSLSSSYALSASYAFSSSYAFDADNLDGKDSFTFATTGSNVFKGNQCISGSTFGEVKTITISSNTASVDFSISNYFMLTLVSGSLTLVNPTNVQRGQVVNMEIKQSATSGGRVSFPSTVKFPTGSVYTASIAANDIDVLTLICFDGTNVRAVPAKLFI